MATIGLLQRETSDHEHYGSLGSDAWSTDTVSYHGVRGRGVAVEQIRDHRRIEVGRMMLARVPIRTMAARLHCSTATVQKDIKVVERWWQAEAQKTREEQLAREKHILDELERAWIERALYDPSALDGVLRIQAQRAKLFGLNAPTSSTLELTTPADDALAHAWPSWRPTSWCASVSCARVRTT